MHRRTLGTAAQLMETAFESTSPFGKVAVDSRLLSKNDLFFALPGEKTDGHCYLEEIARKGAAAAVINADYQGADYGLNLIRVPDVLRALQLCARNELRQRGTRIVGVTGSVGKTTTKDFIGTLLKESFKVGSTPGNSNSQIGMPLAILNETDGSEDILVVEMGMTHAGNIRQLTQIAPPTVALITNVSLVHAVNFDSLADIAKAKAEIFQHPKTQAGIFNQDISHPDILRDAGNCRKISYSAVASSANYVLEKSSESFDFQAYGEKISTEKLQVPGQHNLINVLGAIAVARYFEMPWPEIKRGLGKLVLPERRMQMICKNGITFVNDSYNASEVSLKAALTSLPEPHAGGKKIAVIGEMLELGKFSEKCHHEVAAAALMRVDHLLCIGKECAPMHDLWTKSGKPVYWLDERSDKNRVLLAQELKKLLVPGDVVLLKGSRANQLWKILEEI